MKLYRRDPYLTSCRCEIAIDIASVFCADNSSVSGCRIRSKRKDMGLVCKHGVIVLLLCCSTVSALPSLFGKTLDSKLAPRKLLDDQTQPAAERLKSCINSHQPDCKVTTWQTVLDEGAATVTVSHIVWSERPPPSQNPMTVTTGLSLNRLHQLKAQCMTWPGALSAVVYLAIIQDENHASLEPTIQQEVTDRLSLTLDEARARVSARGVGTKAKHISSSLVQGCTRHS